MRSLLLDGNNLVMRHFHQHLLMDPEGRNISGVFGFLKSLRKLVKQFRPDIIYVCWDSGRSPRRKKIYPDYKKRDFDENQKLQYEDVVRQMGMLYDILKFFPVVQLKASNPVEADDIIATLSLVLEGEKTIVSADKDFYQLVGKDVMVYSPTKDVVVEEHNFREQVGIARDLFLTMRMLMGDNSDNIPGYEGVGEKTATDILVNYGGLDRILEAEAELCKSRRYKKIFEDIDLLERNRQLMDLRLAVDDVGEEVMGILANYTPGILMYTKELIQQETFNHGFKSIFMEFGDWILPFEGLSTEVKLGGLTMKQGIEWQVCNLELSKRLCELGVKQESMFWWCEFTKKNETNYTDRVITNKEYQHRIDGLQRGDGVEFHKHQGVKYYSAFTVAELGAMLPEGYGSIKTLHRTYRCGTMVGEKFREAPLQKQYPEADTEADCRAEMLIYLIENKLVGVNKC